MTVIVESKKMKVTEAIRMFAQKQAQKLTKISAGVSEVRIYLESVTKKKSDERANMVTYCVSVPGKDIVVKKHAVDMYAAIVDATKGAVRKLRKSHEKRTSLKRGIKAST